MNDNARNGHDRHRFYAVPRPNRSGGSGKNKNNSSGYLASSGRVLVQEKVVYFFGFLGFSCSPTFRFARRKGERG